MASYCCVVLLFALSVCLGSVEGVGKIVPVAYSAKVVSGPEGSVCPAEQTEIGSDIRSLLRDSVIPALRCNFGECASNPAASCAQIAQENPSADSGTYWIKTRLGTTVQVYCDFSPRFNNTGGWMRVAFINTTDDNQECPYRFDLVSTPKRTCERRHPATCTAMFFSTFGLPYSKVCGRVIGYQDGSPDAFWQYFQDQSLTIDDNYLDGVSITYGNSPRKHIWTFAAAVHEVTSNHFVCPCTKTDTEFTGIVPPFIGQDYFCDSASRTNFQYRFYPDDPLWDGSGCGETSTCCQFNNPPWFCKELSELTLADIELRSCGDQHLGDENVALELVELYVQ